MEGVPFSSSLKVEYGLGGPGLWSAYSNVLIELSTLHCRNLGVGGKGMHLFWEYCMQKKKKMDLTSVIVLLIFAALFSG